MTDRDRLQNYYQRDRSYSRDRSQKYYDKNKSCRRDRSPEYYKNNYEREYYHTIRNMEIGENIKIVIKTNIGMKISMIMIDLMIQIIPKVEIGHIVETGTSHKNTKETGHTIEMDYMAEMIYIVETSHIGETGTIPKKTKETGHIAEINHKTTVEMSIRKKVINVREALEIIMKTPMRTGMIGININTNTEMKAII